jgi:ABC-2 type transport system ATP-binding protein
LVKPTAGSCAVLGADPSKDYDRVQRRIGSIVDGATLFPHFSGRRNLALFANLYGIDPSAVDRTLSQVELSDRADDPVRTYSFGMRQRLALAAALLKDPQILILDEPANGLDPAGIVEVRGLLRALGDGGRTIFLSTHLLAEVEQICDHVAILSRGRCVASGPVEDVISRAAAHGLMLRVTNRAQALRLLAAAGIDAMADGDLIRVSLASQDSARVAQALDGNGVYITELRPFEATLEEAFMSLTEDASPDAS